jgi:hypothetical protein
VCSVTSGSAVFLPTKDTWVDQSRPNDNLENDSEMKVGCDSAVPAYYEILLQFHDLDDLPPPGSGAVLVSADLMLATPRPPVGSPTIAAYRITMNWNPDTVTYATTPPVDLSNPYDPHIPFHGRNHWDVTEFFDYIWDGTNVNNGLKLDIYTGDVGYATFLSREGWPYPQVTVEWLCP